MQSDIGDGTVVDLGDIEMVSLFDGSTSLHMTDGRVIVIAETPQQVFKEIRAHGLAEDWLDPTWPD